MDVQRVKRVGVGEEQQQPQQQQRQRQEQPFTQRIYLVTDGLRSKYTKRVYRIVFNQFLKEGTHTTDIQVLLGPTPAVTRTILEIIEENERRNKTTVVERRYVVINTKD